jgi:hypothetical protein
VHHRDAVERAGFCHSFLIHRARSHKRPMLVSPDSLLKSIELDSDAVLSAPYNAAWKPQTVIWDDQCEFIGNAEKIGKLQRCTGAGYVTNNAWILVAAIVHLGSFHNFNAWRNPSFDHRNIPDPNSLPCSMVTLMSS